MSDTQKLDSIGLYMIATLNSLCENYLVPAGSKGKTVTNEIRAWFFMPFFWLIPDIEDGEVESDFWWKTLS